MKKKDKLTKEPIDYLVEELKACPTTEPFEEKRYLGLQEMYWLVEDIEALLELVTFKPKDSTVYNQLVSRTEELKEEMDKEKTESICPKCGSFLYNSDVEGYEHVCLKCDENF